MPATAERCPCLIGGKWMDVDAARTVDVWNPSTGETIAQTPMCTGADVDRAVQAALKAFPSWRETPIVDRARMMFKFHSLLLANADDIARIVSREHGKTFNESKASVARGIEMVEYACSLPALIYGDVMHNIAPGVDSETIRYPLGICAGITPFNFPAMVPLWMYPIAITCGNCFILKPSPRVPLSSIRIAELLVESGVPEGVFSMVHGDKECVDAILKHPDIRAVSFVGSTPIAKYIYETGAAHGKRVQAAGGAKNHIIVMPDAEITPAVSGLLSSAFGCSGERCMAGSLAVAVGDRADEVVDRLVDSAKKIVVGRTDMQNDVTMGPVISRQHAESVRGHIDTAEKEGARIAVDGRGVAPSNAPNGFYVGPTVVDHVSPEMRIGREEVFGPVLSVARVKTLEDAIDLGNKCPFGNGAVIFTQSGRAAREFKHRFNAGMIGINVGVPAPMAWFPFTGWNQSFFGDLHIQGKEGMQFYTQQRMIMTRWFEPEHVDAHDPVWRPGH